MYCGTGGCIDHIMANLQVIAYLSANDMRGFLFDKGTVIYYGNYECNTVLTNTFPIGVSNEFIGRESNIRHFLIY